MENLVSQKLQENTQVSNQSGGGLREKKIMDIIDNQGKDIAVDFARMETQIADIQNTLRIQPQMPQQRNFENPEYENRISDIYHKLDELESHMAIREKQRKLERISRSRSNKSRSKSQTRLTSDFEAMEKRLQGHLTNKLAKTVEQLGGIIKK